jgi:hypothetical protein
MMSVAINIAVKITQNGHTGAQLADPEVGAHALLTFKDHRYAYETSSAIVPVVHDTMIIHTPSLSRDPVTSTVSPVVDESVRPISVAVESLMIAHSPFQRLRSFA